MHLRILLDAVVYKSDLNKHSDATEGVNGNVWVCTISKCVRLFHVGE